MLIYIRRKIDGGLAFKNLSVAVLCAVKKRTAAHAQDAKRLDSM